MCIFSVILDNITKTQLKAVYRTVNDVWSIAGKSKGAEKTAPQSVDKLIIIKVHTVKHIANTA